MTRDLTEIAQEDARDAEIERLKAEIVRKNTWVKAQGATWWECRKCGYPTSGRVCQKCENIELQAKLAAAEAAVGTLNELRSAEGASVEILCDNPDGPPSNAILVWDDWTGWKQKRFEGESLADALSNALAAKGETRAKD